MDCKKNLILLTASLPFGRQETFLENALRQAQCPIKKISF